MPKTMPMMFVGGKRVQRGDHHALGLGGCGGRVLSLLFAVAWALRP